MTTKIINAAEQVGGVLWYVYGEVETKIEITTNICGFFLYHLQPDSASISHGFSYVTPAW